jgi:hypothetical protein
MDVERLLLIALVLLAMGSLLSIITPYRIWLLVLAAIAAVVLGGHSWVAWSSHRFAAAVLAEKRIYSLETTPLGEHKMRVASLSLVDGFAIHFAEPDGAPRYGQDLRDCGWQISGADGPIPFHPDPNADSSILVDVPEKEAWVEVSYRVDSKNQALLKSIRLRASPSPVDLELADMTYHLASWIACALTCATLLALAGVFIQLYRRRRPTPDGQPDIDLTAP